MSDSVPSTGITKINKAQLLSLRTCLSTEKKDTLTYKSQ